ncbi:MAG: glycogen debranching protein [Ruminococcus sp.]|nr:glycogen debranching protein [Ruminococcus sp.]
MRKVQGSPQPLGATRRNDGINFAVSVPAGKACELLLYKVGGQEPEIVFDMPEEEGLGEVRFLAVEDLDADSYEYNFRIGKKVVIDPYVRELSRSLKFGDTPDVSEHKVRGRIPPTEYDWEGDGQLRVPYHEVIAYGLHVRGFTKHSSSKVKHRGTFAGVVEKIPYLKELGINQIQCMPVYEFDENNAGKVNYWGYGKGYYFAPKAAYSVGGHASRELKDMVKACHAAGIEVVLEMPFVPDILPHDAVDCLKYYMLEYHVDGFVVNPYHVPWEGLKQDPLLKGVKIMQKDDRFQNVMRRFLKGDEGMVGEVAWALQHNTVGDGKCNYITTHTGFTMQDLVSYDAKHNEANGERNQDGPEYNYSWNCGAEGKSRKRSVVELRKRQVRNAFLLLLTAQGTPCILAGDEMGHTQKGNNNVYCQDNDTAWLNWDRLKKNEDLFRYVKELIAFRKTHRSLHRAEPLLGLDKTACGLPDVSYHGESAWRAPMEVWSRQLGVLFCDGVKAGDRCYVAYNMHWLDHEFAVPPLSKKKKWHLALDTANAVLDGVGKSVTVSARSIVVLVGE